MSQYENCIVTGAAGWMGGMVSRYNKLYRDRRSLRAEGGKDLCRNTLGCIATGKGAKLQALCRDTARLRATTRPPACHDMAKLGARHSAMTRSWAPMTRSAGAYDTAPLQP